MNPVTFKEVNVTYAEDQPEYVPLPVFKSDAPEGMCVSCWQLSLKERVKILFTGKLWLSMWTFHKPLTPVLPTVCCGHNKGQPHITVYNKHGRRMYRAGYQAIAGRPLAFVPKSLEAN